MSEELFAAVDREVRQRLEEGRGGFSVSWRLIWTTWRRWLRPWEKESVEGDEIRWTGCRLSAERAPEDGFLRGPFCSIWQRITYRSAHGTARTMRWFLSALKACRQS
jgi:hypothetical protein